MIRYASLGAMNIYTVIYGYLACGWTDGQMDGWTESLSKNSMLGLKLSTIFHGNNEYNTINVFQAKLCESLLPTKMWTTNILILLFKERFSYNIFILLRNCSTFWKIPLFAFWQQD